MKKQLAVVIAFLVTMENILANCKKYHSKSSAEIRDLEKAIMLVKADDITPFCKKVMLKYINNMIVGAAGDANGKIVGEIPQRYLDFKSLFV